jgi:hypothetical protein
MRVRRAVLAAAAAALVGGGAGLAAAVIAGGGDGGDAPARPAAAPAAPVAKATPVSNQIRLGRAESLRLLAWADLFRECMGRRGVQLAEPVAHPKEIDLALGRPVAAEGLAAKVVACGDALGEPPRDSSLQLRPGKLVLYLPRRCLLDPKVAKAAATSS